MAPNVPNGGRAASHAEMVGNALYTDSGKKVQLGLEHQARSWPAARDHKGSSPDSIMRQDGKSRGDMLDYAAEQFFLPPSFQDQPIAGGSMSSTAGPNSNQPSQKRKLNPIFVEALMRWPTGLSGFERPETAWTRWWLLMPSFLSMLCSRKADQQQSLF
jgi:DNA (cytosine-5)-methyltransferase 1